MGSLEAARRAWAALAGVEDLERLQVVVDEAPRLCRPGWIGIVAFDGLVTAVAPTVELAAGLRHGLGVLEPERATCPEALAAFLPTLRQVRGPAALFYPSGPLRPPSSRVERTSPADLATLIASAPIEELDESGLAEITSHAYVARSSDGVVVAASGYRHWPHQIAHLSVLTHPEHRRHGLARETGTAAVLAAQAEGLVPQWRAASSASKAVAVAIGLAEMGSQVSLQPRG
jgi:GNAT superfamily N-acetyltransferase